MIYFISGHRDVTREEFERTYIPAIQKALNEDPKASFVVGDYEGVDTMAQEFLVGKEVTVYHMKKKPRHLMSLDFKLKGGYPDDESRDAAMTHDSDKDIAFLRKGKRNSGTAQNILRRLEKL